jgi:hypothetical protein
MNLEETQKIKEEGLMQDNSIDILSRRNTETIQEIEAKLQLNVRNKKNPRK